MARLPQLISTLAQVDGRRPPTIEHVSRFLREAGLLATGKRGVGAPEMHFDDAAALLIGVNSSDVLIDSAAATKVMLDLRPAGGVDEALMYPLPEIEAQTNFGDALACVLKTAPHLVDLIDCGIDVRYCFPYTDEDRAVLRRQIRFDRGPCVFRIEMARTSGRLALEWTDSSPVVVWEKKFSLDLGQRASVPVSSRADRKVTAEVGLPTIIALHECIAGKPIDTVYAVDPAEAKRS